MDMREQKFGIEIEMTGITRQRAAEVMAAYFSSEASYDGGSYEVYSVRDAAGRMIPALRRRKRAAVMRGVSTR